MKQLRLIITFITLSLLPTGCAAAPPDFPILAGSFKFVGCCSVIASLIWAYAIIRGSSSRKGGD